MNWYKKFDKRQLSEIEFSLLYARDFQHGTDGHNAKLIIAQMAVLLSGIENTLLAEDNPADPRQKQRRIEEMLGMSGANQEPTENEDRRIK